MPDPIPFAPIGDKPQSPIPPLPFEPLPSLPVHLRVDSPALADARGKRIGVLIVTYNALTTLTRVLKRIPPSVWENVEEIAVFDDASQDSTYELAMGLKALRSLPKLKVLHHPSNLGYGGNQKAGYQYFIDRGFDVAVLLHGDGQYAPECLAHMYQPIAAGEADAVFGSRMMRELGGPLRGGMPLYKYVGNRILTEFENRSLGLHLTEFHSGYRAYSLAALRTIDFSAMTDDFHFDTEIIIKLSHQRYRITEIPIPTRYGDEVCHVDGLKYAKDILRAVVHYKRTVRGATRHNEFAEYFAHYAVKTSRNSSHDFGLRMVSTGQDVLDLGCGRGVFAAKLQENGNRVSCVDRMPKDAVDPRVTRYRQADLDQGLDSLLDESEEGRYSRILFLDVLPQLRSPDVALRDARRYLSADGRAIVSIPNVANFWVRLNLLFGRFPYADRGILDRNHLHFFTRKTALQLLEQCGFEVTETKTTVIPTELLFGLDPAGSVARSFNLAMRCLTALLPKWFGYQFVFSARVAAPEVRTGNGS